MPNNLSELAVNRVTLFTMAGVATAPAFLDEFRLVLENRLRQEGGLDAVSRTLFPYGDWTRRLWPQIREIRHDMRLSFSRMERSVGGNSILRQVLDTWRGDGEAFILIGHSGGGVAALHGAKLLLERLPEVPCLVVQIGSPKCPVPPALRSGTAYFYAVNGRGKGKDPVCRLGSWGGWRWGRFGAPVWDSRLYPPESLAPLPIAGGHADYFRGHLTDSAGRSNLKLTLDGVWEFIRSGLSL